MIKNKRAARIPTHKFQISEEYFFLKADFINILKLFRRVEFRDVHIDSCQGLNLAIRSFLLTSSHLITEEQSQVIDFVK
jgi:hypothetical protein